jgi:hypothetical protein
MLSTLGLSRKMSSMNSYLCLPIKASGLNYLPVGKLVAHPMKKSSIEILKPGKFLKNIHLIASTVKKYNNLSEC